MSIKIHFSKRSYKRLKKYEGKFIHIKAIPDIEQWYGNIFVVEVRLVEPMLGMVTYGLNGEEIKRDDRKIEMTYRSFESDQYKSQFTLYQVEMNNLFVEEISEAEQILMKLEWEENFI